VSIASRSNRSCESLFLYLGLCILLMTSAGKPEEVKALLEVGFEYVCQKDNLIFLRKRK